MEFARTGGNLSLIHISNLDHAFPDRPPAWRRRLARAGSRRLVETAMLSLATPYLSERRIRAIASLAPSVEGWARDRAVRPRAVVFGTDVYKRQA